MLLMLHKEFGALHKNGDKPPKLTAKDKPCIDLKYLKDYRAMDSIAAEYGVCKGMFCLAIQWSEVTPVKDSAFTLPVKKTLNRKSDSIRYIKVYKEGIGNSASNSIPLDAGLGYVGIEE
jgi:hypothetical protein